MTQNKKIEEKEYLEYFLTSNEGKKWYKKNKIKSYIGAECPDFIFTTEDNQKIGLEVTQFIFKSQHGLALQHLMSIGNQIRAYTQKNYKFNISILIDKLDKRELCPRTWQEFMDVIYNPGFCDIYSKNEIKPAIEQIVDKNVEKLKQWPHFIKESIQVQNEYFNIKITTFADMNGKFDCTVNNASYSKEDPFDELQETINNKNKKIDNYFKNCDRCFLLVYIPNVLKGNYCHFTNLVKKHLFYSKFENIFLCQWDNKYFKDENFVYKLKSILANILCCYNFKDENFVYKLKCSN